MNDRDKMKHTLKIMNLIAGKEKKVRETLVSDPNATNKKEILKEESIKVAELKKNYDNKFKGLKEFTITKESVAKVIANIFDKQGTIRGQAAAKKLRESLRQIVNDDKLWRGASAKREWRILEKELREEFKKMDR